MNPLVEHIIAAHGGLQQWRRFSRVRAHLVQGGALWGLKGQGGVLDDTWVTVDTTRQWASHEPFGGDGLRSEFFGDRVALVGADGSVHDAIDAPRASFAGHTLETPWNPAQLAFFAGCAMWTYLNMPFLLAWNGVVCEAAGTVQHEGEAWQKIAVTFPKHLEVFSHVQAVYVGGDYLVRRLDYDVEIAGNTPGAHFVSGYQTVDGIRVPMHRRIYPRLPDGTALPEPLVVSIDLDHVQFS